jgi:WD40 repeat protein
MQKTGFSGVTPVDFASVENSLTEVTPASPIESLPDDAFQPSRSFQLGATCSHCLFNPDGAYLWAMTTASDDSMDTGTIRRIPLLEDGQQLELRPDDLTKLFDFDISQCGEYIAGVGSAGKLRVWDTTTGTEQLSFRVGVETFVSFSPDSTKIFTGGHSADFSVYDWKACKKLITFDSTSAAKFPIGTFAKRSNDMVAYEQTGEDNKCMLVVSSLSWIMKKEIRLLEKDVSNDTGEIVSIIFTSDDKRIGICAGDYIMVINITEKSHYTDDARFGRIEAIFRMDNVNFCCWTPDNKWILGADASVVKMFDVQTGGLIFQREGDAATCCAISNQNVLAFGGSNWDISIEDYTQSHVVYDSGPRPIKGFQFVQAQNIGVYATYSRQLVSDTAYQELLCVHSSNDNSILSSLRAPPGFRFLLAFGAEVKFSDDGSTLLAPMASTKKEGEHQQFLTVWDCCGPLGLMRCAIACAGAANTGCSDLASDGWFVVCFDKRAGKVTVHRVPRRPASIDDSDTSNTGDVSSGPGPPAEAVMEFVPDPSCSKLYFDGDTLVSAIKLSEGSTQVCIGYQITGICVIYRILQEDGEPLDNAMGGAPQPEKLYVLRHLPGTVRGLEYSLDGKLAVVCRHLCTWDLKNMAPRPDEPYVSVSDPRATNIGTSAKAKERELLAFDCSWSVDGRYLAVASEARQHAPEAGLVRKTRFATPAKKPPAGRTLDATPNMAARSKTRAYGERMSPAENRQNRAKRQRSRGLALVTLFERGDDGEFRMLLEFDLGKFAARSGGQHPLLVKCWFAQQEVFGIEETRVYAMCQGGATDGGPGMANGGTWEAWNKAGDVHSELIAWNMSQVRQQGPPLLEIMQCAPEQGPEWVAQMVLKYPHLAVRECPFFNFVGAEPVTLLQYATRTSNLPLLTRVLDVFPAAALVETNAGSAVKMAVERQEASMVQMLLKAANKTSSTSLSKECISEHLAQLIKSYPDIMVEFFKEMALDTTSTNIKFAVDYSDDRKGLQTDERLFGLLVPGWLRFWISSPPNFVTKTTDSIWAWSIWDEYSNPSHPQSRAVQSKMVPLPGMTTLAILKAIASCEDAEIFNNEILPPILTSMWFKIGYSKFHERFCLYVLLLFFQSFNAYEMGFETDWTLPVTGNTQWAVLVLSISLSAYFLKLEIVQFYRDPGGYILDYWNYLNVLNYVFILVYTIIRIRCGPHVPLYAAAAILLSTFTFLYYLRGFESAGFMVRMIIKNIIDMRVFVFIMGCFVFGFSMVFYFMFLPGYNRYFLCKIGEPPNFYEDCDQYEWACSIGLEPSCTNGMPDPDAGRPVDASTGEVIDPWDWTQGRIGDTWAQTNWRRLVGVVSLGVLNVDSGSSSAFGSGSDSYTSSMDDNHAARNLRPAGGGGSGSDTPVMPWISFKRSLRTTYEGMLGGWDNSNISELIVNQELFYFYFVVYTFITFIVMFNLLVAILAESYANVAQAKTAEGYREKLSITLEYFGELNKKARDSFSEANTWVHVLETKSDSEAARREWTDEVADEDLVKKKLAETNELLAGTIAASRADVDDLQGVVDEISKRIAAKSAFCSRGEVLQLQQREASKAKPAHSTKRLFF